MNDDLHSVTLLAGNVCNVDHTMACLTYCLHEGKKKMSPAVPDGKRKNSYPVHYHLLHSVKSPVTPCVTGDYDGRDYENYHIMECDTMWPVRNLLTFQGNVSDPYSS